MDKLVYSGSIAIALVLIAGSYLAPNDSMMWLASTSILMNAARLVVVALMLALIFTNPPRRHELRLLLGIAAGAFAGWAVARIFSGTVQVADAFLFLSAAVSFGIAAIEAPVTLPAWAEEPEFSERLQVAVTEHNEVTLKQRLAMNLFAVQLLYQGRHTKPRWVDLIVHHANGTTTVANAHSP